MLRILFLSSCLLAGLSSRVHAQDGDARRQCSGTGLALVGSATAVAGGLQLPHKRKAAWIPTLLGAALTIAGITMAVRADAESLDPHAQWIQDRCRARWLMASPLLGLAVVGATGKGNSGLARLQRGLMGLLMTAVVTALVAGGIALRVRAGGAP